MANCKYCLKEFTPPPKHPKAKRCSSSICKQQYKNEWARFNPKHKKEWLLKNKQKRKASSDNYRKRHAEYYRQYASLRARKQQRARPSWLNEWEEFWLLEIYHLATLKKLEVDHIIPITNKTVCGLHVPWNLQLLTRTENAQKSNNYDEDVVVAAYQNGTYSDNMETLAS